MYAALLMGRPFLTLLLLCGLVAPLRAQSPPDPDFQRQPLFTSYAAFLDALRARTTLPPGTDRTQQLDAFWQQLQEAGQIPYAHGDSVAFLYRGAASSVAWRGDFNGWGQWPGTELDGAEVWIYETTFPSDARLDYKVFVDGTNWILDPANPLEMWGGFGPNSELRMPTYVYPQETVPQANIAHGILHPNQVLTSRELGYNVQYRVYTPAGYDTLSALPVLYVTDGHEYLADHLGSLVIVLDNLIAAGEVAPLLAVFVDPRNPANLAHNRRQEQYADAYDPFAAFLVEELVPALDGAYATDPQPTSRAILGTSLGGLFAGYLGATQSSTFGKLAIQSPAFWYDQANNGDFIYQRFQQQPQLPLDIFMTTGTINDTEDGARRLRSLFEAKGYPLVYHEVAEGHSWGNWRALLDDMLRHFWGTTPSTRAPQPALASRFALDLFPNPATRYATLHLTLPQAQRVTVDIVNLLGQRQQTLLTNAPLPAGTHPLRVALTEAPSGLYFVRVLTAQGIVTHPFFRLR